MFIFKEFENAVDNLIKDNPSSEYVVVSVFLVAIIVSIIMILHINKKE